ncbi:hypothetical protein Taro_031796 [Colocasia esculenta]|uniref:Bet v I/Major latex protein domain-containing protein n=1 Tax=Colocasia esculenta TaxID=4460 RepID=A0A843W7G8_COLES|nr:hypothetical protein [Colocasia esculenta]
MPIFTEEFTSKVAPSKLFQAGAVDSHNLIPKLMPEAVSSATLLVGDGGVGTVKLFKFTDVVPYDSLKERVELLDKENLEYTHSWIEGGLLGAKLQSATYNIKIHPGADGGSVIKITVDYQPKPGAELTEADINADKEESYGVFQAVEAYLLANPGVYAA